MSAMQDARMEEDRATLNEIEEIRNDLLAGLDADEAADLRGRLATLYGCLVQQFSERYGEIA